MLNPPVPSEAANVSPLFKSFAVSDLSVCYAADEDKEVRRERGRKGETGGCHSTQLIIICCCFHGAAVPA